MVSPSCAASAAFWRLWKQPCRSATQRLAALAGAAVAPRTTSAVPTMSGLMGATLNPACGAGNRAHPEPRSGSALNSGAQVREHGEHAPAACRRVVQPQLEEDAAHVALDRLRAEEAQLADAPVGVALGHQPEDLALARGELVERPGLTRAVEQAVDDRRVEHALARRAPPQRVAEHAGVADALLEQVAGAGRVAREQR